jgi:polar amino acid transport system substrate-binding protein
MVQQEMKMPLFRRNSLLTLAAALLATTAIVPAASAETTLERIKRDGRVVVGTEAAFPPFEFVQDGEIVGYGKDILDVVIAELGVELEQLDLPWQGILPGLLAGQFDFVATTVSINEERAQRYAYTVPIADGAPWFVKRVGDDLDSEDDLAGLVVGTQLASSTEPIARALDERLTAEGQGFAELKLYTSFPDTYVALANGEIDAAMQALPPLAVLVQERPEIFELGGPVATGVEWTYLSWVTRPEDTDLRDFISSVNLQMRDDGRLAELQEKWFGTTMEIPDGGYLPPDAH